MSRRARWPRVFGVQASVVSGGVLCVVAVLVCGALLPRFRAYTATAST